MWPPWLCFADTSAFAGPSRGRDERPTAFSREKRHKRSQAGIEPAHLTLQAGDCLFLYAENSEEEAHGRRSFSPAGQEHNLMRLHMAARLKMRDPSATTDGTDA